MAINFKPINEVPVIEALSDGDTLLVNSGGTAKQIDASLVGGSGGGTMIYLKDLTTTSDTEWNAVPCKDAELTQVMSTADLAAALAAGPVVLHGALGGEIAWLTPCTTALYGTAYASIIQTGAQVMLFYLCSDTSA